MNSSFLDILTVFRLVHCSFESKSATVVGSMGQIQIFRSKFIIFTQPYFDSKQYFRDRFWSESLPWGLRTRFQAYFKLFRVIIHFTLFVSENMQHKHNLTSKLTHGSKYGQNVNCRSRMSLIFQNKAK